MEQSCWASAGVTKLLHLPTVANWAYWKADPGYNRPLSIAGDVLANTILKIGIEKVELNAKGEKLFGKDSLVSTRCTPPRFPVPTERLPLTAASFIQMLHKYHKRFVSVAAPGFSALASNNEILLSNNGKTLTLQGHPERTEAITADLVAGDDGTYISNVKKNIDVVLEDPGSPHDGLMVWDSLMHWVDSD